MKNILVLCEYAGNTLRGSALSALNAGRTLARHHDGDVAALLIGQGALSAAGHAKKFAPRVFVVDDAALVHYLAETYAPLVARVAKECDAGVVVATATNLGKDLCPRVAALLQAPMVSDVAEILGKDEFKRAILAGNAIATVKVNAPVFLATVRQSEFPPVEPLRQEGTVQPFLVGTVVTLGAEFKGIQGAKSERPDLTEAKVIVAGGRGMKNGENFKHLEALADLLGGAVGASRAATDAGFVPPDWQIGQTGKVVAPDLYIAVGISGAIQHLAGMKGSRVIVAINKDPEAPIFQVADYGWVTTWEQAIPELTETIRKHRAEMH